MKRSTGQQIAIWTIGLLVTGAMVFLGLWQMDRFRAQGQDKLIARLQEPPVELAQVAPAGRVPGDSYGRTISAHGTYLPDQQLLIPEPDSDSSRVVTALRLEDGSVLPVVRGLTTAQTPPPPPGGQIDAAGVFLPTEAAPESAEPLPPGQIGSLRLPMLAQIWPQDIPGGFLALEQSQAAAQQLQHWQFAMPSNAGQARSNGYALQWWAFAAAAIAATVKLSRDAHRGTGFMAKAVPATAGPPQPSPVDNSVEKPVGGAVDEPVPGVDKALVSSASSPNRADSAADNVPGTVDKPAAPVHNVDGLPPQSVDNTSTDVDKSHQIRSDQQE